MSVRNATEQELSTLRQQLTAAKGHADSAPNSADSAAESADSASSSADSAARTEAGRESERGTDRGGGILRFDVEDSGIGIPESVRGRLFEAFSQADNSSMRKHGGTGLGLAIVRRFVHAFGGKVWVESDATAGCKFSFLIPLTPASPLDTNRDTNRGQSK